MLNCILIYANSGELVGEKKEIGLSVFLHDSYWDTNRLVGYTVKLTCMVVFKQGMSK